MCAWQCLDLGSPGSLQRRIDGVCAVAGCFCCRFKRGYKNVISKGVELNEEVRGWC